MIAVLGTLAPPGEGREGRLPSPSPARACGDVDVVPRPPAPGPGLELEPAHPAVLEMSVGAQLVGGLHGEGAGAGRADGP
jgi:hypothetical protein